MRSAPLPPVPSQSHAGDFADAAAVAAVVAGAHARHGQIHGVFHAMKHLDPTDLTRLDRAVCEAHFRGKVRGLLALHAAVEPLAPDFALVVSSLASVLGGLGFGAYAAANAAIDAQVQAFRARSRTPWLSVNWDVWQHAEERGMGRTLAGFAVTLEEGLETIGLLQRSPPSALPPQLVISSGDLSLRLEQWTERKAEQTAAASAPASLRDELELAYLSELGLTEIAPDKSFYELGGDSLLAIQVTDRLERNLGVHVAPQDVMSRSVEQLLALIDGREHTEEPAS